MKKIFASIVGAAVLVMAPAATHAESTGNYNDAIVSAGPNSQSLAPGGTVTITAQNFEQNCPVVFTLASATTTSNANASGTATATLPVPTTPGSYTATAACGSEVASFGLAVAAPAPANPGAPGTGLPATGTDSTNWALSAGVLTLVGFAMVGVAALRRKPRLATQ